MDNELKIMRWDKLDMLTINKKDAGGNRLPFYLRYCKKDGGIIDQHNVLCTSVDHNKGLRTVRFLDTADANGVAESRTLRDILILQVDNFRIIKG